MTAVNPPDHFFFFWRDPSLQTTAKSCFSRNKIWRTPNLAAVAGQVDKIWRPCFLRQILFSRERREERNFDSATMDATILLLLLWLLHFSLLRILPPTTGAAATAMIPPAPVVFPGSMGGRGGREATKRSVSMLIADATPPCSYCNYNHG